MLPISYQWDGIWTTADCYFQLSLKRTLSYNVILLYHHFEQYVSSLVFTFSTTSLAYINDVFKPTGYPNTSPRMSFLKLSQPSWKTNYQKETLLYIASTTWNSLLNLRP